MLKKTILAIASLAPLVIATSAWAGRDHDDGDERRPRHYRHHYHQHHFKHYYPRPVVVMPPEAAYYAPPPVYYYAPPPVIHYAPPPPAPVYYIPAPAYGGPQGGVSVRFHFPL